MALYLYFSNTSSSRIQRKIYLYYLCHFPQGMPPHSTYSKPVYHFKQTVLRSVNTPQQRSIWMLKEEHTETQQTLQAGCFSTRRTYSMYPRHSTKCNRLPWKNLSRDAIGWTGLGAAQCRISLDWTFSKRHRTYTKLPSTMTSGSLKSEPLRFRQFDQHRFKVSNLAYFAHTVSFTGPSVHDLLITNWRGYGRKTS